MQKLETIVLKQVVNITASVNAQQKYLKKGVYI